jgi:hypothetical protein
MLDDCIRKVTKDKPFADRLDIVNIEKLASYRASEFNQRLLYYGISFRILGSDGKYYKLRMESSIEAAEEKERVIRSAQSVFPNYYARDRNYLLTEFLQGRILSEQEEPGTFFKIGEMCGEINKISAEFDKKRKLEQHYYELIDSFFKEKKISGEDHRRILKLYDGLLKKIHYEVVLGFTDFQRYNFIVTVHKKIYFVDEGGVNYNIKGYGFNNVMNGFYFFRLTPELNHNYIKSFFRGYNSANSTSFLNDEYLRLVAFLEEIDNAQYLLRLGRVRTLKNFL